MLKLINYLCGFWCICFLFNLSIFAQSSSKPPIVYRLAVKNFQTGAVGDYISVIDASTQEEINQIQLQSACSGLELSGDQRRAFLKNRPNLPKKGLLVVDLAQNNIRELFLGEPICRIKLAPDGLLWLAFCGSNQIVIINTETLAIISRIPNINNPTDIVFSPTKNLAYVSLDNSNILVIDTQKRNITDMITNLPAGKSGFLRDMEMAISPDGTKLALSSKNVISILDTSSLNVVENFSFPNTSPVELAALFFSADSKVLYIAEIQGDNLYTYDFHSKLVSKIFTSIGRSIQNFKLSADGRLIYVSTFSGRAIIDTKTTQTIFGIREFFSSTTEPTFDEIALAGDFTIGQAPTLQTLSPMTTQQVIPGQPFTIRWNTTVAQRSFSIASHKVELSTDGGMTFSTIPGAEQLKADVQQFVWQVPDIEIINKAQIRVSTVDLGAKRASSSSGNFTISKNMIPPNDTQPPMVVFLSPKGSEQFNAGDNLQITWMSSDNVGVTSQDLSLSTDGGNTFPITVASGLAGTAQSFSFPIPSSLQTQQARLRLTVRDAAGNMAQTMTAANFRIESNSDTTAPVVTISQPTNNQSLIAGQPIQVKWQSTDNRTVMSQALLLSLDGGATFTQLASFGSADNSFVINNIDALNMTNSKAVVRITATDASGNIGQANAQFVVAPAITNAVYQAKLLIINGIGFMSNATNSTIKLFVNEKEVTVTPMNVNNTTFTIKGNKKKLGGIVRGNNTVRLVVDGVSSNSFTFSF